VGIVPYIGEFYSPQNKESKKMFMPTASNAGASTPNRVLHKLQSKDNIANLLVFSPRELQSFTRIFRYMSFDTENAGTCLKNKALNQCVLMGNNPI
jgi:hypothetical protein